MVVATEHTTGLASYTFAGKSYSAQWIYCVTGNQSDTVAVFHRMEAGFDAKVFCDGWIAQVLIHSGYNVVAVNRPSYAGSTGPDDFSGPQSITATEAGIKASGASHLVGAWGFDSGSIAAAFYAKKNGGFKWAMLGTGFYDLESTVKQTTSTKLKDLIASTKSQEGDIALERRSIAWDVTGLPKTIILYHAKGDTVAPHLQADAFNDQLRTSEFKVFHSEINSDAHELPWHDHYMLVRDQWAKLK